MIDAIVKGYWELNARFEAFLPSDPIVLALVVGGTCAAVSLTCDWQRSRRARQEARIARAYAARKCPHCGLAPGESV